MILLFLGAVCLVQSSRGSEDSLNTIIPRPLSFKSNNGAFEISPATMIWVDQQQADLRAIGQQLADGLKGISGHALKLLPDQPVRNRRGIRLVVQPGLDLPAEAYRLEVTAGSVTISAKSTAGLFYGAQSLQQLVRQEGQQVWIPAVSVYDRPRFAWRGMMLDVGRYFYSVDFIKKMLDNMAIYKMNRFHWHLTDDQGWRIEIKKYPELTAKGAWRSETQFARGGDRWVDKNPHGGFYTQEQIREVVRYAQSKFITVVPEIEMPGHSLAALSVFPELSCTGGPFKIPGQWKIEKDVYCAGNEKTFAFLQDVLSEVIALFPGTVIHIGGDECPKDRWKACAKCQQRIKEEGLKDEHELQSYFIKRMERFLLQKKKTIIGWDEILEGGLAPNAMVMSWRGTKGGLEAAKLKHSVVMSPNMYMYFDYYQGEHHIEPYANGNLLPIKKVYEYEPVPEELTENERPFIAGVQANVWTEFIHSNATAEYMIFPRIAAAAEVGWTSKEQKNWTDFSKRIEQEFVRYDKADIHYARSIYNVWCRARTDSAAGRTEIVLEAESYRPEIRYTLDGSTPTATSALYKVPVRAKLPVTVNAAVFRNGKRLGAINTRSVAIIR